MSFDEKSFNGGVISSPTSEEKHNQCEPFRAIMEALAANKRIERHTQGERAQNDEIDIEE